MFLFVLLYVTLYFFAIEKYKASLLIYMPAFLVYFITSGLQFNVGTDYFSYVSHYNAGAGVYLRNGELLFYYLVKLLHFFQLPAQSLFLSISFIQSIAIFYYLKKIHKKGFVVWLFFISFICVTNIYNNQLNILRQYVVICLLPIMTIILYQKKYYLYLLLTLCCSLFHASAFFLLILIPMRLAFKYCNKYQLYFFTVTPLLFILVSLSLSDIINLIAPTYAHYLGSRFSEGISISAFFTKLYYLPAIFYFYYLLSTNNKGKYLEFGCFIFSCTYWFFIISMQIGIANRIFAYFIFFYSFPIYFVFRDLYHRSSFIFAIYFLYITLPYLLKVTFFARSEFAYQNILFSF